MFKHLASLQPMLVSCKVAFIYTPPPTIAYLFAFPSYCPLLVVNGSIEYHRTVGLCTDSSTIQVYWVVSKIACSTEVQSSYFLLWCEYCYTTFLSLLLMKLLVPRSDVLFDVSIPPSIYWLLSCWLCSGSALKLSTALPDVTGHRWVVDEVGGSTEAK